jgi:protein-S-isoprenylcysteine O-methyltransferase Ste14
LRESRQRSRKAIAAAGSVTFLVLVPGVVAGVIPWLLTGWEMNDAPLVVRIAGGALVAGGAAFLLHAFARFVIEGVGTPAPVAPTERLVVGGVYRYVRNPMYLAVAATICGQALLLGQWGLLAYAAVFVAVVATFVITYEEPTLEAQFGAEYEAYRRAVPGWLPRLHPWSAAPKLPSEADRSPIE